ncbi:MAG: DUF1858 domain-containing protein [Bacteroidota bacterium]|jgi:uncharacterized protein (DUF2249 family)
MEDKLYITPKTKVGALLDSYPQLEETLIALAPAFKQLKNPVLRKTLAKVASLEQAAAVGNISVDELVNKLRAEAGQNNLNLSATSNEYLKDAPVWFKPEKIVQSLDAREMIATGQHPLAQVVGTVSKMKSGEIYELITGFLPAPLIDKVQDMGCLTWSNAESDSLYKNYIFKK